MIRAANHVGVRTARLSCAFGFGVLVTTFALADPASPDPTSPDLPTVTPVTEEAEDARMPRAGQGAWRGHVQLVWNSATSRLERRRYEIFDPFAEAGFDLFWEPRDIQADRPGRIEGLGVLSWRKAGDLPDALPSIVARYRGETADGWPHGRGAFIDRSGLRYDGTWAYGLMDGEGHLRLPNGDVYRGGFKGGRLHGRGVFIDAAGRVYDGGFADGLRDGPAQVAGTDGRVYRSVWRGGVEDELQRGPATDEWARLHRVQARGPAELAIPVGVGAAVPGPGTHGAPAAFGYAATSSADRLEIYPDSPRLLDVWRGRANIVVDDPVAFDWARNEFEQYSFLNYSTKYPKTAPVQFGLENRGTRPVTIVGGYLDMAKSQVDTQPLLQSLELKPMSAVSIAFSIENYGWSTARNARLSFRFENTARKLQTDLVQIRVGDVSGVHQFSFTPALEQLGVRVRELPRAADACLNEEASRSTACLGRLVRSGIFGRLGEYIVADERRFGVRVTGKLDHAWTDANGKPQTTAAPFEAFLRLGNFSDRGECESADTEDIAGGRPFRLAENRQRYRIPFPLQQSVAPGEVRRWRIMLDAAKSSNHDMRIVLTLADGQEVVSRDISLLMFAPKTYPASVRPFEPRC